MDRKLLFPVAAALVLLAACDKPQPATTEKQAAAIPAGKTIGPVYIPPEAQNISGVWWIKSYSPHIAPAEGGELPFTDEGRMRYAANQAGLKDGSLKDDARRVCLPDGVPRILSDPYPFEILQAPGQVVIAYEINHVMRPIALDKPLPSQDELEVLPFYSGHSVGHWEGDTLVIETAGFNDTTFIDATGVPHSDRLRTVERVRKLDPKTLEVAVTVTDPVIFTKSWNTRLLYELHPETRLEDYNCGDSHRDISHVPGVKPPA